MQMPPDKNEVEVSRHAAFRVVERSGLGPRSIQEMLEKEQYFWALKPLEGRRRYALIFDSCTGGYVVAILAPATLDVITVLTQDQFETWLGSPINPLRMQLARSALLKGDEPDVKPKTALVPKEPEQATDGKGPLWRFDVELDNGETLELGTVDLAFVQDRFLFVFAPSTSQNFERRSRRVAGAYRFAEWFLRTIRGKVDPALLISVKACAVDSDTQEVLWVNDVTDALKKALFEKASDYRQRKLQRAARAQRKVRNRMTAPSVDDSTPAEEGPRLVA